MLRSTLLICFWLFTKTKISFTMAAPGDSGCSALPLLPNRHFVVVWNHPTSLCEDHGIHLDFDKWGILDNTRDRFFGNQIVLFYSLGKWPYYTQQNRAINGGVPQLSDIKAHLAKVENDLKTSVWDKSFSGLGVIDMEYWRPLYWTNYDSKSIYQQKSRELVQQRFPQYNQSQVVQEAIREFNNAARDFMGQTLLKVTTSRPNGKWGYYLFPRCFDSLCNRSTIRNNDRIDWLFENSTALFPSIYFQLKDSQSARATRIRQTLHEAFRVKAKFSAQDIPVMPYSKSQEGPYKMYQTMDLSSAILQPAEMGASGVVIWGSSSSARAKNECLVLQEYIEKTLGPYSRNVTNFFGNCSEILCNNHGRCVRKDYEKIYQHHLRESGRNECVIPKEFLCRNKKEHRIFPNLKKGYSSFYSDKRSKLMSLIFSMRNSLNFLHHKVVKRDSQNVVGFSAYDNDKEIDNSKMSSPNVPNTPFSPEYDFDDYVCKCYKGYSGKHCTSE